MLGNTDFITNDNDYITCYTFPEISKTEKHIFLCVKYPFVSVYLFVQSDQKPMLYVFNAVTGETFPVMGSTCLLKMSVSQLKTHVSAQSGLPISVFRLTTPAGVQLYDCNTLQDYAIGVGAILRLDTWDGWVEYLQGCLLGHRVTVQSQISQEKPVLRFQLRVALYIAASFGHLELADWLLEKGVHADQPVGVHPYRQWCHQTAHPDTSRCPVHVAAESSQLLILKLFITKNILTLACRDLAGRDPLRIAVQHGHRECVRYLAEKLCSIISLQNMSLSVRVYLQMKRWLRLVQQRMASGPYQSTFPCKVLLVDGFTTPKMSSKPKRARTKPSQLSTSKTLPRLHSKLLVKPAVFITKMQNPKNPKQNQNVSAPGDVSDGLEFSLPPLTRQAFVGASPSSDRFYTAALHPKGPTPRENAIHCLTMASTFTEKSWSKQLSIARTLARKHIHSQV
ncbi:protein ANKUB1-like isoform X2 [Dunckerocampus dactyliophorus]|uniref:protein ANKUB1-like isoform X2 n=1 Tax=Dunckerocampus dactyliophorus TaxID=161453 RepID=UPI00240496EF|nr:protein ANKUB1-like isoform X2 [Dunckerocampus dactyliophorus]